MWRSYFTFWWRKPSGFTVSDDIRFVVGHHKTKAREWTAQRICYNLVSRTGIAFRFSKYADWKFIGYMRLENKND